MAVQGLNFIQELAVVLVAGLAAGWVCQRIGLSVVIGYLVAGMLVGPNVPPLTLVHDLERIETLAQMGLVFLMFSIGLGLSLRRLRQLGFGLLVATLAGALLMYQFSRFAALALGWSPLEGVFLAGMLMVSSSAIIAKVLRETGSNHERSGQLAMGVSVLEDVVAVVMLTVLNSLVHLGRGGMARVPETVLLLLAFVVVAGLGGLVLVPWLLRRMSIGVNEELQTLGLAALLFGLAVVAQFAGYSLALGAFLLGSIVAETPHRHQVERTFEGMRDVFSAVFFVAIGMQINVAGLAHEWPLILGLAAFTLAARLTAVTTGMALVGTPLRDGVRAGLTATPIGEFSFIIAQLGVTAKVVPDRFYPLAVGISLLTTLVAPLLRRRADVLADLVVARQPRWLSDLLEAYQRGLERLRVRGGRNILWQLSRKRVLQVGVGMLFVTGLVVFSGQLFALVEGWLEWERLPRPALQVGLWLGLTLVALAPLVAIWRNLSAMALLYAELLTRGHPRSGQWRPVVETAFKFAFGLGLYVWLLAVLPTQDMPGWLWWVAAAVGAGAVLGFRRRLIYWHSELEVEILSALAPDDRRLTTANRRWLEPHGEWHLTMIDCTLPDLADCQGRVIGELRLRSRLGCSIVGIERQGCMIPLPAPETALYPRDKVLLLGTDEQVQAGRRFLQAVTGVVSPDAALAEVRMEPMQVPAAGAVAGRNLRELGLTPRLGVQVAGVRRGEQRRLNPGPEEVLHAGDEILVLGTPAQLDACRAWLAAGEA